MDWRAGTRVFSVIVASRRLPEQIDDERTVQDLYRELDRLVNRLVDKGYQPAILRLAGRTGTTLSVHVGCSSEWSVADQARQRVLGDFPAWRGEQSPDLFYWGGQAYPLTPWLQWNHKPCYVRGRLQACRESWPLEIKLETDRGFKSAVRMSEERLRTLVGAELSHLMRGTLRHADCTGLRPVEDDNDRLCLTVALSAPPPLGLLHAVAASATSYYRAEGLACSGAQLPVKIKDNEVTARIKICQKPESKEDCRCR
ncbi:MAG: hypothetical protein H7837_12175 [Magnetococcus sp. MYC-9]